MDPQLDTDCSRHPFSFPNSSPEPRSTPLSSLVEQVAQKALEAEAHPVYTQTQLLQKNLGKQTPADGRQTDYMGTFFRYCSTLAAVLLRSLSSEPGK